ncbi:ankyrin repeat domain-containing protein, partial [bacterium]|nr:ankyrin repeat domain-containing protein [bacterium]
TIAAVLVVGCGEAQQSAPAPESKPVEPVAEVPSQPSPPPAEVKPVEPVAEASQPEPQTAKAPDISIDDAAKAGDINAVKQHLAAGTDVNDKDWNGDTPLYRAAEWDHKAVAELLIAEGADVNAKNRYRETPLHYAAASDRKEIAELLIAEGADVNAKSNKGWTPLHNAQGNEIVELLIAEGADVNAKNDSGKTPLDHNQFPRDQKQADLLRKHGGKTGEELKAEGK